MIRLYPGASRRLIGHFRASGFAALATVRGVTKEVAPKLEFNRKGERAGPEGTIGAIDLRRRQSPKRFLWGASAWHVQRASEAAQRRVCITQPAKCAARA